jgi:PAS domain S-box-containing protein
MSNHEIDIYKRLLDRERQARKEAERILENKSKDLYIANQELIRVNQNLEQTILDRTKEIELASRFPKENPNPVFRISFDGFLLFANDASQKIIDALSNSKSPGYLGREWKRAARLAKIKQKSFSIEIQTDNRYYLLNICPIFDAQYINVYGTEITKLREAEKRIDESQQQFGQIVENASDMIFRADENGLFHYINPSVTNILGYTQEDLLGKLYLSFVHPDYLQEVEEFYDRQLENKVLTTYYEFPVFSKNQQMIWLAQNTQMLFEPNGQVSITSIARDITAKRESDQAVLNLKNRLITLLSNFKSGVLLADSNGKVETTNEFLLNWFQINISTSPDKGTIYEIFDQIIPNLVKPDEFKKTVDLDLTLHQTSERKRFQLIDGRVFDLEYTPIITEQGEKGSFWFFHDVSDEFYSQTLLKRSEEKYRGIIENLEMGILEVDNDENIIMVNDIFYKMLGYDDSLEMVGKNARSILLPENIDKKEVFDEAVTLREKGKSNVYEALVKKKDGSLLPIIISGAPILDETGKLVGSIGLHVDISSQKETERVLAEAKEKAEASSHAKEVFLAHMSHEIRTPMNAIIGMSSLLTNTELTGKQKVYLDAIRTSSKNLLSIINDILDFSKIEAGKLNVEQIGFSVEKLVKNAVGSVNHLAAGKSIMLSFSVDSHIHPVVLGDPTRINQVLLNLLSNAIKFTPEGKVDLSAKMIQAHGGKQEIVFEVKDSGIGIDPSKMDKIFESFSQEDESISRKFGGTGLGLTISKQLVELMGGKIWVESKKGIGTSFYFSLELNKGQFKDLPQEQRLHLPTENKLKGINVLLVEDNQLNQFLATTILEGKGMIVETALNGIEALDALKKSTFDLILMDIQMPYMGGIEATEIIRRELKLDVPIIALTAKALTGDEDRYKEAGMNEFVSKPFEPEQLLRKIAQVLKIVESDKVTDSVPSDVKKIAFSLDKIKEVASGNEEFIVKMISIFVQNTPDLVQRMHISLQTGDFDQVYSMAHQLKPSIDLLEINEITQLIRHIEESSRNRMELDTLSDKIDTVDSVLTYVVGKLKADFNV